MCSSEECTAQQALCCVVGDVSTMCNTAGSITMLLSDFKQICLVTWGIQKQKISMGFIISMTKAMENTWEATPCLISNLIDLSDGTLRLCNSETGIPK